MYISDIICFHGDDRVEPVNWLIAQLRRCALCVLVHLFAANENKWCSFEVYVVDRDADGQVWAPIQVVVIPPGTPRTLGAAVSVDQLS